MKRRVLISTSTFRRTDVLDGWEIITNPFSRKLSEDEIAALLLQYQPDALLAGVEPLTARVLEQASSLRIISRCGAGLDSVDLAAAKAQGIAVRNTAQAPAPAVAEMAVALMLSSLRNIAQSDAAMKAGTWHKQTGGLLGSRTVGIVGCGRIGSLVAHLVQAFGSTVYGYDPCIASHPVCTMVPIETLWATCDIVSLHLPLSQETKGMVDSRLLASMKRGALLVNTSRGEIVDEDALYDAVKSGKISAALDVFCKEPYQGKLLESGLPVVLSPHQGSSAAETRDVMEAEAATYIIEFFKEN